MYTNGFIIQLFLCVCVVFPSRVTNKRETVPMPSILCGQEHCWFFYTSNTACATGDGNLKGPQYGKDEKGGKENMRGSDFFFN